MIRPHLVPDKADGARSVGATNGNCLGPRLAEAVCVCARLVYAEDRRRYPETVRLRPTESPSLQLNEALPPAIVPPSPRVSVPVSWAVSLSGFVDVTLYEPVCEGPPPRSETVSVPSSVVVGSLESECCRCSKGCRS